MHTSKKSKNIQNSKTNLKIVFVRANQQKKLKKKQNKTEETFI